MNGKSFGLLLFLLGATLSYAGPYASVVQTQHFELRTFSEKDRVLSVYAGDVLEKAYERIGENLGARPAKPVPVEFYPSWKAFIDVSTLTETEVRTTGTIALCKFGKLMLTTPRALAHGYPWMDTATHEFTHFVISLATEDRTPVWLHEGIAKYEEVRWRKESGGELPRDSQALLQRRWKGKTLIPFERFHPSIAKLKTAEDAAVAFAEAYYFVKYLIESRGGYAKLRTILGHIREGTEAREAIALSEGQTFEKVFSAWLGWLGTQNLPVDSSVRAKEAELKESDQAASESPEPVGADVKVRDWVILGDLLHERERSRGALLEYTKAQNTLSAPSVGLLSRIAEAAIASKDKVRAMSALNEAAELAPDFPSTFVRRAGLYWDEGKTAEAERDLLQALSINPFDPRIHQGLLKIAQKKKDRAGIERSEGLLRTMSSAR